MCLRSLAKYFTVSFFVLVLTACGSSSSNQDGTSPETQNTISILGSDGPMAGAKVEVFVLAEYLTDSDNDENVLADETAITDRNTALADDLKLKLDAEFPDLAMRFAASVVSRDYLNCFLEQLFSVFISV